MSNSFPHLQGFFLYLTGHLELVMVVAIGVPVMVVMEVVGGGGGSGGGGFKRI